MTPGLALQREGGACEDFHKVGAGYITLDYITLIAFYCTLYHVIVIMIIVIVVIIIIMFRSPRPARTPGRRTPPPTARRARRRGTVVCM